MALSQVKVLFVCLGNICRSPTAEGVFHTKVHNAKLDQRIITDSAGTAQYHVGKAPDKRSTEYAAKRGYDLSPLRARQVTIDDYSEFDYIIAMDHSNLQDLAAMQPKSSKAKLKLMLDFAVTKHFLDEVPDPYYGGNQGFDQVLDLLEDANGGLLQSIKTEYLISNS